MKTGIGTKTWRAEGLDMRIGTGRTISREAERELRGAPHGDDGARVRGGVPHDDGGDHARALRVCDDAPRGCKSGPLLVRCEQRS